MTAHALTTDGFVASYYPADQLVVAGPGRRLGAYAIMTGLWFAAGFITGIIAILLDVPSGVLLVPVYLGYFVWFIFAANNGQTPGHQLLGMYIIKDDGTRAGGGGVWLRELVFKGLIVILLSVITLGIFFVVAALWCLWDKDNQTLWDKMGGTYVAWSPNGFKPATANEVRMGAPAPLWHPSSSPVATGVSTADQLRELSRLHDEGILSDNEYESRRERLVREL